MCTAATYKTKDFYFGRTLDYDISYGDRVTVTPRNYVASAMPSVFHSHESSYSILIFSPILSSEKTGGQNANRFSPVSSSWRRSTRPSMMLMTISQVALTNALFRWPPKTSPLSFPALMCMCA